MTGPINPTWPTHGEKNWDTDLNTGLGTVVTRVNAHADQHNAGGGDPLTLTVADTPWTVVSKNSIYTGVSGQFVLADATSGAFTVTPPSPVSGSHFAVKKIDASANAVTVGATVDGSVNPTLAFQHGSMELVGDGSAWRRVVRPSLGALVDYPATTDARYQALDSDLTAIAALVASGSAVIQESAGVWRARTPTQLAATLPADQVAATASLRTLGPAAQQAAAGTHSHGYTVDPTSPLYGARGDAYMLRDAAMTATSATLTSSSAAWTSAVVGRHVQIAGAGSAGSRLDATVSTYISPTQVTLSVAASVTVANVDALVYVADDTTALQSALDAAALAGGSPLIHGATVLLPPGGYAHTGLQMNSAVTVAGVRGASILYLIGGSTAPSIRTVGFSSLTGTGSTAGPSQFMLNDLTVDGFKAGQTATVNGLSIFGFDWDLNRVVVRAHTGDGIYSEWGNASNNASPAHSDSMESHLTRCKIHDNGGWGWHNQGPHDSQADNLVIFSNTTGGYWGGTYSAGAQLRQIHCWGGQDWCYVIDAETYLIGCEAEGGVTGHVLVRAAMTWSEGAVFHRPGAGLGFQIGDGSNSPTEIRIRVRANNFPATSAADCVLSYVAGGDLDLDMFVQSPTPGTTPLIYGTLPTSTICRITQSDGTVAQSAVNSVIRQRGTMLHYIPAGDTSTLRWSDGTTDYLRYRTDNKWLDVPNGGQVRLYSDAYSTGRVLLSGATGSGTFSPSADSQVGLIVKQNTVSQSADLLQIQGPTGTPLAGFDGGGRLRSYNTSATATAGSATLPSNPREFIPVRTPTGTGWIPVYAP